MPVEQCRECTRLIDQCEALEHTWQRALDVLKASEKSPGTDRIRLVMDVEEAFLEFEFSRLEFERHLRLEHLDK